MKIWKSLIAFCAVFALFTGAGLAQGFDGYALYNKLSNNNAYLIDKDGNIAHSWSCSLPCNYSVLLKPNGNIVRGAVNPSNIINGAAVGGRIQEIDPSGSVVWEYTYSDASHVSHHDITLIGDNVLLTAWEVKNSTELDNAGYTGSSSVRWPTHFVELEQDGTTANIVWEWHMWDHMIQDVNASLPNYGVVADHPELMDINVATSGGGGPGGGGGDWFHVNGVDYNPELDQLVFTSRYVSEIFIIDHSTSTAEAASHSGGNAGKGGDFLFRWGNPGNFDMPFGVRNIPGAVHDPRWIKAGVPNEGYIQFFNNLGGSGGGSVVDAINPIFDADSINYVFNVGSGYGPNTYDWRHICEDNASGQSSSDRMHNGNTYVNLSGEYMYEVNEDNDVIWLYNEGPAKGFRYTCDDPGIDALLGLDACTFVGIEEASVLNQVKVFPNPSNGVFSIEGITNGHQVSGITIFDIQGLKVKKLSTANRFDLSEQPNGIYFVSIEFDEDVSITRKVSLIK